MFYLYFESKKLKYIKKKINDKTLNLHYIYIKLQTQKKTRFKLSKLLNGAGFNKQYVLSCPLKAHCILLFCIK